MLKSDRKEKCYEAVKWIQLAQCKIQWQAPVNTTLKFLSKRAGIFSFLFNIFTITLPSKFGGRLFHPQSEDAPCRADRTHTL